MKLTNITYLIENGGKPTLKQVVTGIFIAGMLTAAVIPGVLAVTDYSTHVQFCGKFGHLKGKPFGWTSIYEWQPYIPLDASEEVYETYRARFEEQLERCESSKPDSLRSHSQRNI